MQQRNFSNVVRAGFIKRGTSLKAFCRENGIDDSHASKALLGKWQGEKATELKNRLMAASKGKSI
jgi:hypothetical protein